MTRSKTFFSMDAEQALLLLGKKHPPKIFPKFLRSFYLRHFPKPSFSIIHVAGTNGKGSVSEKLFYAYKQAGFVTGLFTSPHLFSLRERIRLGNDRIDRASFDATYHEIDTLLQKEGIILPFFSVLTLMAYRYFSLQRVDVVIMEVGIGGRFDPTNLFASTLSIITQVDYDHMDLLGESLEEIAYEKAGIIQEGVPVVLGPRARFASILREAFEQKAPLLFTPEKSASWYDEENTLIAKTALTHLGIASEGVERIRPSCRFEQFLPNVIFDGAHNEPAFEALFSALRVQFPGKTGRFFLCLTKGKNIPKHFPGRAHLHLASLPNTRLESIESLQERLTLLSPHTFCSDFTDGLIAAYESASKNNEVLVVTGSFYMMDRAKSVLKNLSS